MNGVARGIILICMAGCCHAQTYSIAGTVMDSAGNGIGGAMVRLGVAEIVDDIWTLSDALGRFSFTGAISGVASKGGRARAAAAHPCLGSDGTLRFGLNKRSRVAMTAYDATGRVRASSAAVLLPGAHRLRLPGAGCGLRIYRVVLQGTTYTFRTFTGVPAAGSLLPGPDAGRAAVPMSSGAADGAALLFTKDGYQLYRYGITNPDTSGVTIVLRPLVTGTVADIEGNVYRTIAVGGCEWTVENLRTTTYNDGTDIPLVADSGAWAGATAPGYCFYHNEADPDSVRKRGALYNWHAVNSGKLAPAGWHVP